MPSNLEGCVDTRINVIRHFVPGVTESHESSGDVQPFVVDIVFDGPRNVSPIYSVLIVTVGVWDLVCSRDWLTKVSA